LNAEWRSARAGLFFLAALSAVEVALGIAMRAIYSAIEKTSGFPSDLFRIVEFVGWGYFGTGVLALGAWWMLSRVPARTGARGWAAAGLVVAIVSVVLDAGRRAASATRVEVEWIFTVIGASQVLLDALGFAALVVVVVRAVGRAVPRALVVACAVTYGLAAVKAFVFLVARPNGDLRLLHLAFEILSFLRSALVIAMLVFAARAFGRAGKEEPELPAPEAGALPPAWLPVADGIGLYVGGAIARVVVERTDLQERGLGAVIAAHEAAEAERLPGYALLFEREAVYAGAAAVEFCARFRRADESPAYLRRAHLAIGRVGLSMTMSAPFAAREACDVWMDRALESLELRSR